MKFIDNDIRGCENKMSKDNVVNLEECKKKCDSTPDCKFFSIDEKHCRTHKLCSNPKDADKFRTTYERKEGNLSKRMEP